MVEKVGVVLIRLLYGIIFAETLVGSIIGVVYTLDEIKSVIERYEKSRRALAGEEERAGESDE